MNLNFFPLKFNVTNQFISFLLNGSNVYLLKLNSFKNNHIFLSPYAQHKHIVSYAKIVLVFGLLFCINFSASAQNAQMKIFVTPPDWNGKKVCDEGNGYSPTIIPAPIISFTGNLKSSPSFNYVWEFKAGDNSWVEVAGGNQVSSVPSYQPKIVSNTSTSDLITYSWRVKVSDANQIGLNKISEIITLSLASKLTATYKSEVFGSDKQKVNINLTVSGGTPNKKFSWSTAEAGNNIPVEQKNREDLSGLIPGRYRVTITDEVCPSIVQMIKTITTENN